MSHIANCKRRLRMAFSPRICRYGFSATLVAILFSSPASAQLQWGPSGTGGNGTWDGTTANWFNGTTAVPWDSNTAIFGGTVAGAVTMNSLLSATGISFSDAAGYTLSGTGTLTLTGLNPTISSTVSSGSVTNAINFSLSAANQVTFSAPASGTSSVTFSLGANNIFSGGILLSGANIRLNLNSANASGTGSGAGQISVATAQLRITNAGSLAAMTVFIPNAIVLNSNNATGTFQTALGATTPSNTPTTPATQTFLIYSGAISGASDVIISNSTTANTAGAGTTIFATTPKTYTGATILNMSNSTGAFILGGADNILPTGTALVFGNGGTGTVGLLDMDGFNLKVASIATNTTVGALGITNTGGAGGNTTTSSSTLTLGGTSGVKTLTISGSATTTFNSVIGALTNGYLTAANNNAGTNNIALNLDSANTGSLTLGKASTYTGGTTISHGTLVAGILNAIPAAGGLTLSGGTLSSGATTGFSDSLGALTVSGNSTIALGTGTHQLTFSTLNYTSGGLTINNWTGTAGSSGTAGELIFTGLGTAIVDNTLYAAFLSNVNFTGFNGSQFITNGTNIELVPLAPVPEPAGILAVLAFPALLVYGVRRYRRLPGQSVGLLLM